MDILLRSTSCLRFSSSGVATSSRLCYFGRGLSTSHPQQAVARGLKPTLVEHNYFSDNVRWPSFSILPMTRRATSHAAADEKEVELESRLDYAHAVRPRGPERSSSSPPSPTPFPPPSSTSWYSRSSPPPASLDTFRANPPLTPSRLLRIYSQLSKARLTTLIVLTAMSGVALSPLPTTLPVLLSTALGTALCCASANTFNQLSESPYDAQMVRTRNRPLVRRAISPSHAAAFGVTTGLLGIATLYAFVNPLTAALGAFNIYLYAFAYTPLKRVHPINTWVGAVVGGIPPVMGWTACGGHLLPSSLHPITFHLPSFFVQLAPPPQTALIAAEPSVLPMSIAADHLSSMGDNPLAPLALFCLLFSWQFPHFNPLAHLTRDGYARAGTQMLAVTDPRHNAMVSLRHATLFIPICSLLVPLSGLTDWGFALTSLLPNLWVLRIAYQWHEAVEAGRPSEKQARALWRTCLWWLPVVLGLMMLHKRGGWLTSEKAKEGGERKEEVGVQKA